MRLPLREVRRTRQPLQAYIPIPRDGKRHHFNRRVEQRGREPRADAEAGVLPDGEDALGLGEGVGDDVEAEGGDVDDFEDEVGRGGGVGGEAVVGGGEGEGLGEGEGVRVGEGEAAVGLGGEGEGGEDFVGELRVGGGGVRIGLV